MKLAAAQHERRPWKLGREEAIAEAELITERHRGRLLNQQRIGPCVDDELARPLGHDNAARPRPALEDDDRPLALPQFIGGREPGDPGPDDNDVGALFSHQAWGREGCSECSIEKTLPTPSRLLRMRKPEAVNMLRECLDVIDRCRGKNAVAEVEDVPGPAGRAFEHVHPRP